jgi:hypothetical protein
MNASANAQRSLLRPLLGRPGVLGDNRPLAGGARRSGPAGRAYFGSLPGRGALTWKPETGSPRADGLVPFYFRSVNVYFRLTDYVVRITSDYAAGSCAFNATLRHEVVELMLNPTRMMYGFRDQVVAALNAVRLPTQNTPQWLRPNEVDAVESRYIQQVGDVIRTYRSRVSAAFQRAQAASDSPASYQNVYRQCPVDEWNRP